MPGTFGQVRHILFPYFNCMIPTNAGLVAGKAYLVAIQLYQNTGRFRTVKIRTFKTVVTENGYQKQM